MCQKGLNFKFFKGPFLRNGWLYGYDFWSVFRDLCKASKKYNFLSRYKFSQDITKVIII